MNPSLLLRNVRPVGAASDAPTELVIMDGRVGDAGDLARATGPLETIDLDGRYVLRGLWDHHVHFDQWALARRRIDLTGATTAAEVVRIVVASAAPGDSMIIGYGFRDAGWPDRPSLAALDAALPDRPVVLASNDLHCAWLNSAAFRRFEILPTADGLIREDAAFAVLQATSDLVGERSDAHADEAARAAAARGLVGIVELEFQDNHEVWSRRVAAGTRSLRVECGLYPPQLDAAIGLGRRTGQLLPDGAGLLTVGPLKIMVDGSLNTRTAACWDLYPEPGDVDHDHGILQYDLDSLITMIDKAAAAGLECAVHAIGDQANTIALDAFAATGQRGRIEHAQLIKDEDLARFAALGVIASVQPDHVITDRDVADRHWPGRTARAYPYGSLLAAGATLRLGSDAPVSPLDPWQTIAAAVHRTGDEREPWHPEQRLTVAAALDASTGGRFTVRPGDAADLVITDLDPLTADRDQLRHLPVHATLLAGHWTHRSG